MESSSSSNSPRSTAFERILRELPRQHLRTRFRNHFGTGDGTLFDIKTFHVGTKLVERKKSLANLIQEQPEAFKVRIITGAKETRKVETLSLPADATLGQAIPICETESIALVEARTARVLIYAVAGDGAVYVRRVAIPESDRPKVAKKPKAKPEKPAERPARRSASDWSSNKPERRFKPSNGRAKRR